jgi:hypothetical protein
MLISLLAYPRLAAPRAAAQSMPNYPPGYWFPQRRAALGVEGLSTRDSNIPVGLDEGVNHRSSHIKALQDAAHAAIWSHENDGTIEFTATQERTRIRLAGDRRDPAHPRSVGRGRDHQTP